MILNLDPSFTPLQHSGLQTITYESFQFSDGTYHIKIDDVANLPTEETVNITFRGKEIMKVLIAVDALKRIGFKKISLVYPFFLGARQDRVMVKGEALTAKVYATLINSMQLEEVTLFDPHSEVSPALLDRCSVIDNFQFIKKVIETIKDEVVLISPDGGALKKIYKLSEKLGGIEVIECSKSRDVKTGKLSGFKVYADDLSGKNCLIVDDICDGGGTFIGLSKELKKKNAHKQYLAVSHGIFSKGTEVLTEQFEKVFTTDSVKDFETNDQFIQLKLEDGLLVI